MHVVAGTREIQFLGEKSGEPCKPVEDLGLRLKQETALDSFQRLAAAEGVRPAAN